VNSIKLCASKQEEKLMARDYFARSKSASTPPSGTVINDVQASLNAVGAGNLEVDGLFGGQTQTALETFQTARALPVTGTVSDSTWQHLMNSEEPSIFERCLQVTASFEGTGFTQVVGNFDGAGITWGIIGFTLAGGELGAVLATINARHPDLMAKAFGDDTANILKVTGAQTSQEKKLEWADSVSRGAQHYEVAQPWKTYFHDLGSYREVQKIQIDRARDVYWSIATQAIAALSMGEELDYMLLYDVAVQNGGLGAKNRLKLIKEAFVEQKPATALARRIVVSKIIAQTSRAAYQNDVLSRKMAISEGEGRVHGAVYKLNEWGLADGFSPNSL
jgi:peptidoglycan hydrolase-like protein with peptidoglycan-binding domain